MDRDPRQLLIYFRQEFRFFSYTHRGLGRRPNSQEEVMARTLSGHQVYFQDPAILRCKNPFLYTSNTIIGSAARAQTDQICENNEEVFHFSGQNKTPLAWGRVE